MEPDGKLIIRLAANPDEDGNLLPTTLVIPFTEMRRWEPMQQAVRIEFPDRRVLIPWWNIIDLECHFNSKEYSNRRDEQGHPITEDVKANMRLRQEGIDF